MSAMGDVEQAEDEREAVLEAAYARCAECAGSPAPATKLLLQEAARSQVAVAQQRTRARRSFAWLLFAAVAAFALAAAQQVYRWSHTASLASVGTAPARPAVAWPLAGQVPTGTANATAVAPPKPPARLAPSALRLEPPGPSPFQATVDREISAHFQALLDSNDSRTWVAGLLFDHARHVVRVADPAPLPDPVDGKPDPVLGDSLHFGQRAFGLRPSQYDTSGGEGLPRPSIEGHPRVLAWYYVLRDEAVLRSEDAVRAAVFAHLNQVLPPHGATADVPVMTVLMTADGRIERFDLQYRAALGGALTSETYAADQAARFAAMGVPDAGAGRRGSMMVASDDLPGGVPGGLVMVDYAWPAEPGETSVSRGDEAGVQPDHPSLDTAAAVTLLHALFTPQQIGDVGDGQEPWVLLDSNGKPLKWGREGDSRDVPLQLRLMQWFPQVRIANGWQGLLDDPTSPRRQIGAGLFWLAPDSPRP